MLTYSNFSNANNYLRATQQNSLQFQATQEPGKTGNANAYNWLTQSSMDTLQSSLFSGSFSETQSALLFSSSNLKNSKAKSSLFNEGTTQVNDSDRDIYRLRRRFVKDQNPSVQNRFYARKQVKKKTLEFFK